MGVNNLWRLLLPIGRRISVETLEGKVLAIDASIWLTQFLKAMRDADTGSVRPGAHLVGMLRRLCKLRYLGIKPVLVFDGATPEVKLREVAARRRRRDQFSMGKGDENDIQRMAKRLLLQQLQKHGRQAAASSVKGKIKIGPTKQRQKPSKRKANASAAPGFFDPSALEEEDKQHQGDEEDKQEKDNEHANQEAVTVASGTNQSESQEPIDVDKLLLESQGADYLRDDSIPDGPGDWDKPLVEIGQKEGGEKPALGTGPAARSSASVYNPMDGSFDVDYVSSLDSLARKEHVETARRQQRMQSRHEFLKVAADPAALSQCQLRNFLRYSSLNSNISKMAVKATQREEDGNGTATAGDRKRRVIFEKDGEKKKGFAVNADDDEASFHPSDWEDEDDEKGGVSGGTFNTRFKNGRKRRRNRITGSHKHGNDDGDDDDDINWNDGTTSSKVVDDSDNEGEAQGPGKISPLRKKQKESNGGFLIAGASNGQSETRARRVILDDDSDEEESVGVASGGFLPSEETAPDKDSQLAQQIQDESLARAIQAEEYEHSASADVDDGVNNDVDDDVDEEALRSAAPQPLEQVEKIGGDDKFGEEEAGGFFAAAALKNSHAVRHAQELADAQLARAVQEAELEGSGDSLVGSETRNSEDHTRKAQPRQSSEASAGNRSAEIQVESEDADNKEHTDSDDDDDDGIDWEDGDEESNDNTNMDDAVEDDRNEEIEVIEVVNQHGTESNQVPVRDNSNFTRDNTFPSASFHSPEKKGELISTKNDVRNSAENSDAELDEEHDMDKQSDSENDDAGRYNDAFGGDGGWGDGHGKSSQQDTDTAAALEQAQATAANLTDWAARAFRRAMAHHAEVTGASPSPSSKGSSPAKSTPSPAKKSKQSQSGESFDPLASIAIDEDEASQLSPQKGERPAVTIDGTVVPVLARVTKLASNRKSGSPPKNNQKNKRAVPAKADVVETWAEPTAAPRPLQDLEKYQKKWAAERNQQERDMDTVTDEMRAEAVQLLELFGVPYVQSPAEAEAQCATLERLGLVDGIVTEDSDAFVFGARTVYRNIFDDQKYVEVYDANDAVREMNLNRNCLVALAMLLGGDYTDGVKGVGIVNGMEILEAFEIAEDLDAGLSGFRKWLDGFDPEDALSSKSFSTSKSSGITKERLFHKNHRTARTRWTAPKNFPDKKILNAYLNPVVDTSEEQFSWGSPDVDQLILFCNRHMGWPAEETRRLVDPVVNRLSTGYRQTRIDSFMRYEDDIKFANVRSKRLRDVLGGAKSKSSAAKGKKTSTRKGT